MAKTETQRRMSKQAQAAKKRLAVVCAFVVWTCGCATRRAPAKPVANFIAVVRPVVPPAPAALLESPPDLPVELRTAPQIWPSRLQPPKPRVPTPATQEPAETEKHVEPMMAPEMTPQEVVTAKTETQNGLDVAEKNLAMTQGRKLNAVQEDLASKVRGFADSAREAMRNGDWMRARNLSKKAEVLSEQLAASL
jgi:hypothetical protein